MTTKNEGISILLANRHYLFKLLQHLFGNEPNLELIEVATSEHTQEALKLLLDEDEHLFDTFFSLLPNLKQGIATDADGTLDKLKSEYTYLMIGPNKLPAPPWESVYVTKERTLFQESTLYVRREYLKYQFLPANYPHEADDHIAFELDFMAHLAKLTLEHFDHEDIDKVKKLLIDQKSFLAKHLLVWVDEFVVQIQTSKTHYLYPQTAALTAQVLKIDSALIDELLSLI